jgi:hypothetical protein
VSAVRYEHHLHIRKSKATPVTGREGLYVCEVLIPHCLGNRLTDNGEVVNLTSLQRYIIQKKITSVFVTDFH